MNKRTLLSIIVPAYQYAEGIKRIFTQLYPLPENCELIIFDDSPGDEVEKEVLHLRAATGMHVIYEHHKTALGAASNWNALLDAAHGEFCLLLHHDEFPLGANFLENLLKILRLYPDSDIFLLDCIIVDPQSCRNHQHLPMWIRGLVTNRFPGYLFRRNVIGPTSVLVIRRLLYPKFDVRLQWFIDVDMYVRLLKATNRVKACPEIKIGSLSNRSGTITKRLGSSIPKIARKERAYLMPIHGYDNLWLGPMPNRHIITRFLYIAEVFFWGLLRIWTRLTAYIHPDPVPRALVKEIMKGL